MRNDGVQYSVDIIVIFFGDDIKKKKLVIFTTLAFPDVSVDGEGGTAKCPLIVMLATLRTCVYSGVKVVLPSA